MKFPTLVPWRVLPRVNQSESPPKSAKVTVIITKSRPEGPRPPKNAKRKAERATALPKMIMEKYKTI
mgnify:CR=1 FL=1